MIDNHGRTVDYVRLAVTDRCNLRCTYCMPEHFNQFIHKTGLLTYEELDRLMAILSSLGVKKLRLTGGEPFVRKDLMEFIENLASKAYFEQITLTTNGVLTLPYVERLKAAGVKNINLSLDTLNRENFARITRRDELPKVIETLEALIKHDFNVKINAVVMSHINTDDIHELAAYTKDHPVEVRFIEEMPFNGSDAAAAPEWNYEKILLHLSNRFDLIPIGSERNGTAMRYEIPKHIGTVGVIAAYSRTFCGTCNRLRISPTGKLKTCLYGRDVASVFDLLRNEASDSAISQMILNAVQQRHPNGIEAEREMLSFEQKHRSMVTIGG